MPHPKTILTARWVLPMLAAPIYDGAIVVADHRLETVSSRSEVSVSPRDRVIDLGDTILMPGLVNAHCHLDYTHMAGHIPPPSGFTAWIHGIQGLKRDWSLQDYKNSWLDGAQMLTASGTTTVCNIESVWDLLPEVMSSTPLRVLSCLELIALADKDGSFPVLEAAQNLRLKPTGRPWPLSLSPHAPYTTTPEFLRQIKNAFACSASPLPMHVAESAEEWDMFTRREGPLFEWLSNQRNMEDCGNQTPVEHIAKTGLIDSRFLAVHANHITDHDARLLSDSGCSIVHCPRSHEYFGHVDFPWSRVESAGIRVCLGTDSLLTTKTQRGKPLALSLFEEMRQLAAKAPFLNPRSITRMATCQAAAALGLTQGIGALIPGGVADVVGVPASSSSNQSDPFEMVVFHGANPSCVMIAGQWVHPPDSP